MMTKKQFEHPRNLMEIAAAMGTKEEKKVNMSRNDIVKLLDKETSIIQAKLLMYEACRIVMTGNRKLTKRVNAQYLRMARELGYEASLKEWEG